MNDFASMVWVKIFRRRVVVSRSSVFVVVVVVLSRFLTFSILIYHNNKKNCKKEVKSHYQVKGAFINDSILIGLSINEINSIFQSF